MKRLFFIFAALLIVSASLVTAQEQTGVLVGTVMDTDGAFLPGVTVEARSASQPGVATAITDEVGRFRLIGLSPGTYQVTFRLPGFQTLIREGILVRLGRTFSLEVTISQATMEEEVTVIGESPVVDIKKSGTTTNYGKEMIAKLPKGRDFTSVVNMTAGVNDENIGGGQMMDGASSSENMYFVDGMDTTSMYTGTSSQRVLMEFVEEVQVKSSGYEAEHGGSMGGVINVITRSGGNEFHGEVSGYLSGSSFQANPDVKILRINPIDNVTAEYMDYPEDKWNQYEVGFGLGGYILKDKLWFFGSFMPRFTTTDRTVELIADGNSYTTTQKQTSYFGQGKLTALLGGFRIGVSYINDYYKWKGSLMSQDGSGALPSEYDYPIYGFNYPGETWGARIDWIASDNLFIGLNGGYFNIDTNQLVGPEGPRYYFGRSNIGYGASEEHAAGWYNYGYYDGYQTTKDIQKRYGVNFDTTLFVDLAGEHVWKAGIQFVRIAEDVDDAYVYDCNYFYWGLNYLSPATNSTTTTEHGYLMVREPLGSIANIHSDRYAIFLQDSWTISNKFTVNIGIRAEKENIPSFSDLPEYQDPPIKFAFGDKIAPRIGFAWDLFGDNSTKVFGSYGLYYDVMKLEMANGSFGGFKWISHYYDIRTLDWKFSETTHPDLNLAPDFVYIESLNWRIPAFETVQPDMEPYSKNEISLGLQRKLGEDVSLTVRYLYNNIRWAIEDIGIQTPEGEVYFAGNPGSPWINDLYAVNDWPECPKAQRRYHSLNVGVDKRFSNNWMAGLHYTYSNLWGNFSGLSSSDEYGRQSPNVERYFDGWFLHRQQDLSESTGQLPTDRPHQFKLYGSYTWDFGLTFGFYSYLMSGTPVSTMLSLNSMQGYYPVGRFDQGRTPMLSRTDLYVEYNFNLGDRYGIQLNVNVSNLFSQQIAQRKYAYYNRQGIVLSDDELLAGFEYKAEVAKAGVQLEPRYLMPNTYTDGIDVRFGVKFIF
jgi:hypothetical protein